MKVEMIRWSPCQMVAEVVSLMHVAADAKGLTLRDEYEGPLPETILTDPARLRQVLINLVGNAVKFTSSGGVRIVTKLLCDPRGRPLLTFAVIDTGEGIRAAELEKLFEPFMQADGPLGGKYEGTGLGLAISRQLARAGRQRDRQQRTRQRQHVHRERGHRASGGRAPGPLRDRCRRARHAAGGPAADSLLNLPCRVLLAEDILDNQRLIAALLRGAGAEVTIAGNGQEVVEQALATHPGPGRRLDDSRTPFDVLLMDMQMPLLDGYEAVRRLRREGYARPIVALTAHAMRGDREKCINAGCDDYLSKPVDRNELLKIVAQWASSRTTGGGLSQGAKS